MTVFFKEKFWGFYVLRFILHTGTPPFINRIMSVRGQFCVLRLLVRRPVSQKNLIVS